MRFRICSSRTIQSQRSLLGRAPRILHSVRSGHQLIPRSQVAVVVCSGQQALAGCSLSDTAVLWPLSLCQSVNGSQQVAAHSCWWTRRFSPGREPRHSVSPLVLESASIVMKRPVIRPPQRLLSVGIALWPAHLPLYGLCALENQTGGVSARNKNSTNLNSDGCLMTDPSHFTFLLSLLLQGRQGGSSVLCSLLNLNATKLLGVTCAVCILSAAFCVRSYCSSASRSAFVLNASDVRVLRPGSERIFRHWLTEQQVLVLLSGY